MRSDRTDRSAAAARSEETDDHEPSDWRDDEFDDPDSLLADERDGGPTRDGVDPMPLVVGAFVACAGVLVLVQPVVPSVTVAGEAVPPFVLSAAPLSLGFAIGTVGFARRGQRTVALAHGVGAVGFGLLFLSTGIGSLLFLWAGLAVLLGGVAFLVAQTRRD
ncbi:hypothetical protein [Halomarina rubra]|uniref:Cox cluster protein n=1 Tax=Halomarina rubra TaxID=2071873 RepID=A0ABD6AYH6_9EURY|nr:hypothetical protein [Halomarina rubra]